MKRFVAKTTSFRLEVDGRLLDGCVLQLPCTPEVGEIMHTDSGLALRVIGHGTSSEGSPVLRFIVVQD